MPYRWPVLPPSIAPRSEVRSRTRQRRSIANDRAAIDATVALLDTGGWEACSVLSIAQACGLSRTPILERFGDRTGIAAAAWDERLAPVMRQALVGALRTVGTPENPTDAAELLASFEPFFDPDANMRAAGEILLVSRYIEPLAQAVASTVGAELDRWLAPRPGRLTRDQAARHAMVAILALGMLIEVRTGHPASATGIAAEIESFARALDTRVPAVRLPSTRALHPVSPPAFDLDDPALADLLTATLHEVGDRGYEAATLRRIALASGFSKGLVFARYASKRDLFLDATDRMLLLAARANEVFQQQVATSTSAGIADATITRETMRPEVRRIRTITTEQFRLAWHDDQMQATFKAVQDAMSTDLCDASPTLTPATAQGRVFVEFARGIGMGVVADLHADAWKLPYDVVLVPLIDR